MEKKVVKIPHIVEELRIGYSFNYLIKVIAETDAAEAVQWDFADANFLHPFFLAPLKKYVEKTYIPLCSFAMTNSNKEDKVMKQIIKLNTIQSRTRSGTGSGPEQLHGSARW